MKGKDVVESYYRCLREGDFETYISLFADDADFHFPDGSTISGRRTIATMMRQVFASARPSPTPLRWIEDVQDIAVEAQVDQHDGVRRFVCSVFTIDDQSRIARLSAYQKGNAGA